MPGMMPGAVPPSLGRGTRARKEATARRTRAREEVRPTKATKLPVVGKSKPTCLGSRPGCSAKHHLGRGGPTTQAGPALLIRALADEPAGLLLAANTLF